MATIDGTEGDDVLTGTPDADIIHGKGGNDRIDGGAGDDQLYGDGGDDTILPGDGADYAHGGVLGNDTLDYSTASAAVQLTIVNDTPATSGTRPYVPRGTSTDGDLFRDFEIIIGTPFDDTMTGYQGTDRFFGGAGNDTLRGNDGADYLDGGTGDDKLYGGDGDTYVGGPGADLIDGGTPGIYGGGGTASYAASPSAVTIDMNYAGYVAHGLGGDAEGDTIINVAKYIGSAFDDLLILPPMPTSIRLSFDGGAGIDTVNGANSTGPLDMRLDPFSGITHVERIIGTPYDDRIYSSLTNDMYIEGGAGVDSIFGSGDGYEATIIGGPGADYLYSGATDTFLDTAANFNGDRIAFLGASDKIVISDADPGSFSFSLAPATPGSSERTLTYSGGTLTLAYFAEGYHLVAKPEATGGVALTPIRDKVLPEHDFNHDGRSDIVWRNDNGGVSDWLANPNATFAINDNAAYFNPGAAWKVVGTGDFDGDGYADLLLRHDNGAITLWLGKLGGGFTNNDQNAFTQVSNDWQVAGIGDFNGDAHADIMWRNSAGQVSNWLGLYLGKFQQNDDDAFGAAPTDWHIIGFGDVNGDGRTDVLWRSDGGLFTDWLGTEGGGYMSNEAVALQSAPADSQLAGVGDFNGDGRADILWLSNAGTLTEWLGQADGSFAANAAVSHQIPAGWHVVDTADYNGDGHDDILWRNDAGYLSDWLATGDGNFVDNSAAFFVRVSTDWHVVGGDFLL